MADPQKATDLLLQFLEEVTGNSWQVDKESKSEEDYLIANNVTVNTRISAEDKLPENNIDVEPVRHGEWESDTCSICGAEWFDWTNMRPFATNYCPSCGAKMNGGKES